MENFRAFDESADFAGEDESAMEAPPEIGIDERRTHVRAYNFWVSLLDGRHSPSIRDLEPHHHQDFGPHCVLPLFNSGTAAASLLILGRARGEEWDLPGGRRP